MHVGSNLPLVKLITEEAKESQAPAPPHIHCNNGGSQINHSNWLLHSELYIRLIICFCFGNTVFICALCICNRLHVFMISSIMPSRLQPHNRANFESFSSVLIGMWQPSSHPADFLINLSFQIVLSAFP